MAIVCSFALRGRRIDRHDADRARAGVGDEGAALVGGHRHHVRQLLIQRVARDDRALVRVDDQQRGGHVGGDVETAGAPAHDAVGAVILAEIDRPRVRDAVGVDDGDHVRARVGVAEGLHAVVGDQQPVAVGGGGDLVRDRRRSGSPGPSDRRCRDRSRTAARRASAERAGAALAHFRPRRGFAGRNREPRPASSSSHRNQVRDDVRPRERARRVWSRPALREISSELPT